MVAADMRLVDPRELPELLRNPNGPNLIWINDHGEFRGPFVDTPPRHVFAPIATATKKQLRRGRAKNRA